MVVYDRGYFSRALRAHIARLHPVFRLQERAAAFVSGDRVVEISTGAGREGGRGKTALAYEIAGSFRLAGGWHLSDLTTSAGASRNKVSKQLIEDSTVAASEAGAGRTSS